MASSLKSSSIKDLNEILDEIEEPSILSIDPEERKLARRLRIQKRQEALKKSYFTIS